MWRCLLSNVFSNWGLRLDSLLPLTSRLIREDIGTGKKMAVGMLVMFVFRIIMSRFWLVIPANAPMAILSTIGPLTPSFLNLGE